MQLLLTIEHREEQQIGLDVLRNERLDVLVKGHILARLTDANAIM